MNDVERRVIDISYKEKIGHLSSNLNAVNIIEEIYKNKNADEPFILSSGHAALALYTVLEKYENKKLHSLMKTLLWSTPHGGCGTEPNFTIAP
jgi:transketolase N-terminal domain/subunit